MVANPGFKLWCDSCNWNVGIDDVPERSGPLSRWYANLGKRHGTQLLDRLCSSDPGKIGNNFRRGYAVATVICLFVMGLSIVSLLFGFWLILRFWPNPFAIIAGVGLVGLAWLQRPRMNKRPKNLLRCDQYPKLFQLINNVTKAMGLPPIQLVGLNHEFNASMSEVTWARAPLLTIGLPLWKVLEPQARVALIAHEVAHRANGDPARTTLFSVAIHALDQWISVLTQDANEQTHGLSAILANVVMWLASRIVLALRFSIMQLLFLDSQRAEYFADFLATKVAGSEAMKSTFVALEFQQHLIPFLLKNFAASDEKGESALELFRKFTIAIPKHEIERMKRRRMSEHASIDATHPPTAFRVQFISAHPVDVGSVCPTDSEWAQIDAELRPLEIQMSERLISAYVGDQ